MSRPSSVEAVFDVLVIGGGHAGTEAAVAAARAGARVGLITSALETIGQMSCNPAIGGVAKSTVVREVDAMGGIMARATDLAMLQFRMLNRSKGAAVWAPRAQCDRGLYRRAVRTLLEAHQRLHTIQGTVARLLLDAEGATALGVETLEGRRFAARAVVLTAGTFLRGRIHIGTTTNFGGGRAGEAAALDLAEQLQMAGLSVDRFKTGTPPRIDGRTVDFHLLERQESEVERFDFSWSHFWPDPRRSPNATRHPPQLPCFITYLEERGKALIRDNIGASAMYGGAIGARGPRYVNGLSTSLPAAVQLEILRSVTGLERVHMTRAGYAIEYDYFPPTQLEPTLQVRRLRGLYLAGQVNGTTGYEEAAGQGLMAGLNAALDVQGREPLILGRETSYIGVLIDDLVHRGVDEPYRLFTSRSEFRLTVRQDNALRRLAPRADALGMLTPDERALVRHRLDHEDEAMQLARASVVRPEVANPYLEQLGSAPINEPVRAIELVRRQHVELKALLQVLDAGAHLQLDALVSAELEIKYAGYFSRERVQADRIKRLGHVTLPRDLPYAEMRALTYEARQKLAALLPSSLAQAASIPGVSPNDIQNLLLEVERHRRAAVTRGAPA
jgi:tRNA uridine 5-carboxymethylaminomethyl modification enzyme